MDDSLEILKAERDFAILKSGKGIEQTQRHPKKA